MANRHKSQCRASGGRTAYQGAGSNVAKAAGEMKRGGKAVGKVAGNRVKGRFARGGSVLSSAGGGSADKSPMGCAAHK